MRAVYFKHRKLFDFKNEFDVGHAISWNRDVEDNHFLYRLYELRPDRLPLFYNYHLNFFLALYQDATEAEFYDHVKKIIEDTIFQLRNKNRYDADHAVILRRQRLLEDFLQYVISTDPEGIELVKDQVIADQKLEINELRNRLADLENIIRDLKKNQTNDYLNIPAGYLLTVVDLIYQLQQLTVDNKELIFSQTQIIWPKIISEYFKADHKDINFETIRRYFPADRSRRAPVKNRLFKISLVNERSKVKQSRTSTSTVIKNT